MGPGALSSPLPPAGHQGEESPEISLSATEGPPNTPFQQHEGTKSRPLGTPLGGWWPWDAPAWCPNKAGLLRTLLTVSDLGTHPAWPDMGNDCGEGFASNLSLSPETVQWQVAERAQGPQSRGARM